MAQSSAVQLWGRQAVLDAFNARGLQVWSICQGKSLILTGEGDTSLGEWLDRLSAAGGTYTLKVYRGIDDPEEITDSTPASGFMNFRTIENPGVPASGRAVAIATPQPRGIAGIIQDRIEQKLASRIDEWLDKLDKEDEPARPMTMGAIAQDFLQNPEKLTPLLSAVSTVLGVIRGAVPMGASPSPYQPQPAPVYDLSPQPVKVAGAGPRPVQMPVQEASVPDVGGTHTDAPAQTDDAYFDRLDAVIDRLFTHDPEILTHLEKLAGTAETNPGLFRQLITMLNGM